VADPGIDVPFVYRSPADLQQLGERVYHAAIEATMNSDDDYGYAQQQAVNYSVQETTGTQPQLPGQYTSPRGSSADEPDNVRSFAAAEYADVPSRFTAFAIPNPDDSEPIVDLLRSLSNTLAPKLVDPHDGTYPPLSVFGPDSPTLPVDQFTETLVSTRMKAWNGPAADAFTRYLVAFSKAAEHQAALAIFVAVFLKAQLEIKRRMLTDVWTLGETTIKKLRALEGRCPTKGGAAMAFTVMGAIGATLLSDGVAVPLFTALGGFGSVLSTGGPYTKQEVLGGGTVPEILQSMYAKMEQIVADVTTRQLDVVHDLNAIDSWVTTYANFIELPEPFARYNVMSAGVNDLDNHDQGLFWDR
jgi:hypothetical protein